MKKLTALFLTMMMFGIFIPVTATAYEWKLDMPHSGVMFEVDHIFSSIRGHFAEFSGEVAFDPDDPGKSRFDFTVKVDSIDTNIGKRDNHLRSDDFFAAKTYPEMTFKSARFSHVEGTRYTLEGKMTIKDVTKDMKLDVVYYGETEHPMQKGTMVAGFETRFTIDRLAFNVGNGKFHDLGIVGKDVDILISFEALRDK